MPNSAYNDWLAGMDPARAAWMDQWLGGIMGRIDPSNPTGREREPQPRTNGGGGTGPTVTPDPGVPAPTDPTAPPTPTGGGGNGNIGSYFGGYGGSTSTNFFGGGGGGGGGAGIGGNLQIAEKMMANEGQLRSLDAQTEAELAKVKEAELLAFQKTMGEQSGQFLENMFGRGIQRSTIAGRVGEQLVASQGLARAQIESQAAQRKIALRQDISDRAIKEAAVASQELESRRGYAVGMAGVAAENARTAASIKIASMETAARMAIAQGQLDLGYAELDLNRDKFGFDQTMFWEELQRKDRQLDLQAEQIKGEKRNGLLGFLGGLGGAVLEFLPNLPFFSHPALKENIENFNVEDALKVVKDLDMYSYQYLGETEKQIGISAPQAASLDTRLSDGVQLHISNVIMTLLGAVKALSARVEELENGRR